MTKSSKLKTSSGLMECLSVLLFLCSVTRVAGLSISTTESAKVGSAPAGTGSFWNSPERIAGLPDPPPQSILKHIQQRPYRGGLEPIWNIAWYSPRITSGSIPKDLSGTLASNGAGRTRIKSRQFGHWFDGDGYITSLVLDGPGNKARFSGRYVATKRFTAQQILMDRLAAKAKKQREGDVIPLAFSAMFTLRGRGKWYENLFKFPENPANTATMWINEKVGGSEAGASNPRLFALCEGGSPQEIDPTTLDAVEPETPFSTIDEAEKVSSCFSAHFSRCPVTGDIFNHGIVPASLNRLNTMQLTYNGALLRQRSTELPYGTLIVHDEAISSNYLIYFLLPWCSSPGGLAKCLFGRETLGDTFQWKPEEGSYIHIHSRSDLSLKWRVRLPKTITLYHIVDAYDEVDDDTGFSIVKVRVAELERPDRVKLEEQFGDLYRGAADGERQLYCKIREYSVVCDPAKVDDYVVSVTDEDVIPQQGDANSGAALCEYPTVNASWKPTQRRNFCWTNAASSNDTPWIDGIQNINMKDKIASTVATFGKNNFAGPPTFIPREGGIREDDGYILVTVYKSNEHRSDIQILNASTLQSLCTLELEHHVPYQFHGDFISGYLANTGGV